MGTVFRGGSASALIKSVVGMSSSLLTVLSGAEIFSLGSLEGAGHFFLVILRFWCFSLRSLLHLWVWYRRSWVEVESIGGNPVRIASQVLRVFAKLSRSSIKPQFFDLCTRGSRKAADQYDSLLDILRSIACLSTVCLLYL